MLLEISAERKCVSGKLLFQDRLRGTDPYKQCTLLIDVYLRTIDAEIQFSCEHNTGNSGEIHSSAVVCRVAGRRGQAHSLRNIRLES